MNRIHRKRLWAFAILLGVTILGSGCISFPVFKNALNPLSDKAVKDLVKSSWICSDDDERMVLSFVQKSAGNYIVVFRKSEFVEGKLEQQNLLLPGRVCKAGKKKFLFLKALDPDDQTPKEDIGYMVFYYEISGDSLNLYLLNSDTLANLVEKGTLQGNITKSRWSKEVVIDTESKLLEKVLSDINLSELIDTEADSGKSKTFKRKS